MGISFENPTKTKFVLFFEKIFLIIYTYISLF